MYTHDEELLEPFIRLIRYRISIKHITKNSPITLVDLGCGPKIRFYKFAKSKGIKFEKYIGIDPLINPKTISKELSDKKLLLKQSPLQTKLPLPSKSTDYVVGFAFLEHIDYPEKILSDSIRVLKKNGVAIFTTPTPIAKRVLEFLSYKLGIISKREIQEHKNYFDREYFNNVLSKVNNIEVEHKYFELGMNNLLIIRKS